MANSKFVYTTETKCWTFYVSHGYARHIINNCLFKLDVYWTAIYENEKKTSLEVRDIGGELFVFANADSHFAESEGVHVIRTPRHVGVLSPTLHTIPVQF